MEDKITFKSGDLTLSGALHTPDGEQKKGLPCVIVLHGFGSNKESGNVRGPCKMLNDWGYAAFRFDMRGCGESEGDFGRVICKSKLKIPEPQWIIFKPGVKSIHREWAYLDPLLGQPLQSTPGALMTALHALFPLVDGGTENANSEGSTQPKRVGLNSLQCWKRGAGIENALARA